MKWYKATAALLAVCASAAGQTSFWTTQVPAVASDGETNSVTLGLRFYSDVPGSVIGVRFYKGSRNTGTHTGQLWSSTGAKLAEVVFSNETATGWQQARFSSPVAIAANTTYIVSYLASRGGYAANNYYPWTTVNATPLHVSGSSPGVYTYGTTPRFPTSSWNGSNYWVDVLFMPATSSTTYNISGRVTGTPATVTLSGTTGGTTTTDSAGNYSFANVRNGSYVVAASQTGYTFSPSTAAVSINGASVSGVNFTGTAVTPVSSSVSLGWVASTSSGVVGYNLYRATAAGGPYVRLNGSRITSTAFVDTTVEAGRTYYYVATAIDGNNTESDYSNQASAQTPR